MTSDLPGVTPGLRASDADRDLAVDVLCVAAGDGRLTAAELDERLEAALTARTIGELAAVTADLPGGTMFQAACQAGTGAGTGTGTGTGGTVAGDHLGTGRWAFLQWLVNQPRSYEPLVGLTADDRAGIYGS
jgi:hypothetical protein